MPWRFAGACGARRHAVVCAAMKALRTVLGVASALGLACNLHAQQLTLNPAMVNPGDFVQGSLFNDREGLIFYVRDCEVRTLRHSGEHYHVSTNYASPRTVLVAECDQVLAVSPGETYTFFFDAPSDPGSYTVVTSDLDRAAARLDVVAATTAAQDVCFYPTGVWLPQGAHEVDFALPSNSPWEFANTGSTAHVFGAGDRIQLFTPGGTTPVASVGLGGVTVPAGRVTEVALPLGGLDPGPYVVEASFVDASAGPVVTRSGVQPRGAGGVELHMYGGREFAPGEQVEMAIAVTGFSPTGPDPFYFMLVGLQPGTTALPGGIELPLVFADPLVGASVHNGIGGLLVNRIGRVSNVNLTGNPFFAGGVDGIGFTGPPFPSLSGLVLRVAVLAVDPAVTVWAASQPEELTLL